MAKKPAILVVDDEPDLLSSLAGWLRREFELYTAESGDEALAIMAEHPIQVLMTDQRMPGMTGSELLRKVCQDERSTVLILFTGYADIKSVVEAVNTGRLFRYVTKPWDPEELVELLREAAAEHERKTATQDLKNNIGQFVSLGQQISEQLSQDSGRDGNIDQETLAEFAQACESLAKIFSFARVPRSGDS